ncbi:MAG: hypothetical protein V4507_05940 [Verrucomicrobiota bacterium]
MMSILLTACGGIKHELQFTRSKPQESDLIGLWVPTPNTLKDMEKTGGYVISKHEILLKEDGTFSMINMPDWWRDGFGDSKKGFESSEGRWELTQTQDWTKIWDITLHFSGYGTSVKLLGQKPPYRIHIYVGDPDSGHVMLFEKK